MNEMNPFAVMGSTALNQPGATLLLYTPRIYGTQVLRPFLYGFDNRSVDTLLGKGDTMIDSLNRADVASSPEIVNAIKPDSTGTAINMDCFSTFWTFLLILREPRNYNSMVMQASGLRVTVMTGHCLDEPIAPNTLYMSTPIVNHECRLCVHSRQILSEGQKRVTANGMQSVTDVLCADDIIDPSLNMCTATRDLYYMTPYNVLSNYADGGTEMSRITTPGVCALGSNDRTSVQESLKTPGVHLRQIIQSLDAQTASAKAMEMSPHGISSITGVLTDEEDPDQFKAGVERQLSNISVGNPAQTSGLDCMSIFTIGMVEQAFPNVIIQPQHVAETAQCEVLPQTIMNPKVIYSSMASSAISSIAVDCGLSSLSFMYTSWDPAKRNDLDHSTFQVVRDDACLTCPPNDQQQYSWTLAGAVEMFRQLFQKNVAPFISGVLGNFEIAARYSNTGETLVDLKLLDYGGNVNDNAWFEAPNRLSSLSSTSVGTETAFMNNGQSLNELVRLTQGKTFSMSYGMPSAPTGFSQMGQAPIQVADPSGLFFG